MKKILKIKCLPNKISNMKQILLDQNISFLDPKFVESKYGLTQKSCEITSFRDAQCSFMNCIEISSFPSSPIVTSQYILDSYMYLNDYLQQDIGIIFIDLPHLDTFLQKIINFLE